MREDLLAVKQSSEFLTLDASKGERCWRLLIVCTVEDSTEAEKSGFDGNAAGGKMRDQQLAKFGPFSHFSPSFASLVFPSFWSKCAAFEVV